MKPHQKNVSIDINEIRNEARTSINDGSVTADYPLNLQEAYKLLNDALATEILCVLRYRHHQIIAKGINRIDVAAEFEEHAMEEEQHMLLLAERINQLGGEPDFNPATVLQRSATEFKSGDTLEELIKENLVAERIAIMVYRKLILWFGEQDPTTRRLLELILAEEEEHADDLSDLLSN